MAKAEIPCTFNRSALDLRRSYEVNTGDKSTFCAHPLATIQAHGGIMSFGSGPKVDQAAQQRQAEELSKAKAIEKRKIDALARSRRGRASLISGSETGLSDTLG